MKPIIGIVFRPSVSESGHDIKIVYNKLIDAVVNSGGISIGIPNTNFREYLNICQGFIFQGGDISEENNYKIIKKLHELNIPVLGICQGMQEIGEIYNGKLIKVKNHHNKLLHEINIKKDTLLYKIISSEKIMVNTRHKETIINTNLTVAALSNDNIIEAIEDSSKTFFLGLQWHPETMYDSDINSKKIFDYFINSTLKNK